MDIKDCKVGMKVECQSDKYRNINKGDKLTISEVDEKEYNRSYIYFEESHSNYRAENFEPVNKFEVGDEAIWHNNKVRIWGIRYDTEINMYEYAIEDSKDNCGRTIVFEEELSPLKNKDELEVGDKFKVETATGTTDRINQVLGVFNDEKYNQIKYVAKRVQGDWKGFVDIYNSEIIAEIVYD